MSNGTRILDLAATTVTELAKTPFLMADAVHANSVPGATIYGVDPAGRDANGGNYQRFLGDGTTNQFGADKVANLVNADSAALAGGSILKVIVKKNGRILTRVGPTAIPTAAQFRVSANACGQGSVTFTTGSLPADGKILTIHDGAAPTVFEFNTGAVVPGNVKIDMAGVATAAQAAAATVAAINGVGGTLTVTALNNLDGSVLLVSDIGGALPALAVSTDAGAGTTVVDFTGDADTGPAILFGIAPAAGDYLEVFMASTIATVATLAANVPAQILAKRYLYATAACQLIRLVD